MNLFLKTIIFFTYLNFLDLRFLLRLFKQIVKFVKKNQTEFIIIKQIKCHSENYKSHFYDDKFSKRDLFR